MSRKRRTGGNPEMLSRNITISSFRTSVRLSAVHRRGEEPEIESQPWLELQGAAKEPIRDVQNVKISMYPRDPLQGHLPATRRDRGRTSGCRGRVC